MILVSGAPNASYDVELILTNYKNLSVYKRYFMPFQGKLPIIPQVCQCILKHFMSVHLLSAGSSEDDMKLQNGCPSHWIPMVGT